MIGYITFAIFIAFVLYVARPNRPDKVYHSEQEVRDEVTKNKS
jgi:hypothetical protein